ncbi:MAG: HAD hydrolase-like protein [Bacteroidota bacterium]|nr:HAD hydrolase-like protein [Bacteroidota bacterium]
MLKNIENIDTIFWDWNGTILNDAELCIDTMNLLLRKRQLPPLTYDKYRQIFTFPVRDYYQKAGFDFSREDFSVPATEFIEIYNQKVPDTGIFENARVLLDFFKGKGFRQYIISAMKWKQLHASVSHQGLRDYFTDVLGIRDHFADGKAYLAAGLMKERKLLPGQVCIIGDTLHDHEIAQSINCECILVAGGHQSGERLRSSGRMLVNDIIQLKEIFKNHDTDK